MPTMESIAREEIWSLQGLYQEYLDNLDEQYRHLYGTSPEQMLSYIHQLSVEGRAIVLRLMEDGVPIGFLVGRLQKDVHTAKPIVVVTNLHVAPAFKGKGYGGWLVRVATQVGKNVGAVNVLLSLKGFGSENMQNSLREVGYYPIETVWTCPLE